MKFLLYCNNKGDKLYKNPGFDPLTRLFNLPPKSNNPNANKRYLLDKYPDKSKTYLNGTIIGECDCNCMYKLSIYQGIGYSADGKDNLRNNKLIEETEMSLFDISHYLKQGCGYCLCFEDLKPYDEPKNLNEFSLFDPNHFVYYDIKRAPTNMCRVVVPDKIIAHKEEFILISLTPKEVVDLFNHRISAVIRRHVLKCMKMNLKPNKLD